MTGLNEGLIKSHEAQREVTYKKIEAAVGKLTEEGRQINRPNITKTSCLSPSIFSKKHVIQFLLSMYGIGAKQPLVYVMKGQDVDIDAYNKLLKRVVDLQGSLQKAEYSKEKERDNRVKAEVACEMMSHETKVLRGELDIAQRKLRILIGKSHVKSNGTVLRLLTSDEMEK